MQVRGACVTTSALHKGLAGCSGTVDDGASVGAVR